MSAVTDIKLGEGINYAGLRVSSEGAGVVRVTAYGLLADSRGAPLNPPAAEMLARVLLTHAELARGPRR
jgi:hypothetical protein